MPWIRRFSWFVVAIGALMSTAATQTTAPTPITCTFSGTVSGPGVVDGNGHPTTATITGKFAFNPTTPTTPGSIQYDEGNDPLSSLSYQIAGGLQGATPTMGKIFFITWAPDGTKYGDFGVQTTTMPNSNTVLIDLAPIPLADQDTDLQQLPQVCSILKNRKGTIQIKSSDGNVATGPITITDCTP